MVKVFILYTVHIVYPSASTLSKPLATGKGHVAAVIDVAWSPDGKRLVSGGDDGQVQVCDASNGHQVWTYQDQSFIFAVAWSPDGKHIAAAGGSGGSGIGFRIGGIIGKP